MDTLSDDLINSDETKEKILKFWGRWRPQKTLLIFDDIDYIHDIELFLPPQNSSFYVIATTRNKRLGDLIKTYELETLSEKDALEQINSYLNKEQVEHETEESKDICHFMGYLPLGIEVIARYARYTDELLRDIIPKLKQRRKKWRTDEKRGVFEEPSLEFHGDEFLTTEHGGLYAAFELTWEQLSSSARKIAKYISSYRSSDIYWEYIAGTLTDWFELRREEDFSPERQILSRGELMQFSLLKRKSRDDKVYYYHPLLQDFFRTKMSSGEKRIWGKNYDVQ